MTVKQVAEKVYGPIPDGATLHIGGGDISSDYIGLTVDVKESFRYFDDGIDMKKVWHASNGEQNDPPEPHWLKNGDAVYVVGPDISDRPASSFVGFFGKEFDEAVVQEFSTYEQES